MASRNIDRQTHVLMNLKANKPSIMAMKFADYHAAKAAEAAGQEYRRKPDTTILLLNYPVDLAFLTWFLQNMPRIPGLHEDSDTQESAEQKVVLKVEKLEDGAEFVRLKGNRRTWWNELCNFFGNDPSAIWYMADVYITINGEAHVEALKAARHFPDEKIENEGEELRKLMESWSV